MFRVERRLELVFTVIQVNKLVLVSPLQSNPKLQKRNLDLKHVFVKTLHFFKFLPSLLLLYKTTHTLLCPYTRPDCVC